MIKAVVFDLDGTILNTIVTITHFVNQTLQKHGISPINELECKTFIGDGARKLIERALASKGIADSETLEKILPDYNATYDADPYNLTEKYEGIDELLSELKNRNIKLALLSNKPHSTTASAAEHFFPGVFSVVFGGRAGVPLKPDPSAADELFEALDVKANEVIYVGDSGVDMQFGKAIGASLSLGAAWGFRGADELFGNGADAVFDSPLHMAKYICEKL
jgi:phosphoglycolate phosphatase